MEGALLAGACAHPIMYLGRCIDIRNLPDSSVDQWISEYMHGDMTAFSIFVPCFVAFVPVICP